VSATFVDTSAWFMVASADSIRHADAARTIRRLIKARERLVTTSLVIAELHRLALIKVHRQSARAAVTRVTSTPRVEVVHPDAQDMDGGLALIDRFGDQDFTLTDAVSFAVMERLAIRRAFAYDRHFAVAGFDLIG